MKTITKKANGSKNIAKAMLSMAEDGYYLTSYSLPELVFSDEGERVELPYILQSLVEENMMMLNKDKQYLTTDLIGLVEFYNKKEPTAKKGKVKIVADGLGDISYATVQGDVEIPTLPPSQLKTILKVLKKTCVKNAGYRQACMSIVAKVLNLEKTRL